MAEIALTVSRVDSVLESLLADAEAAAPRLITGLIFLLIAYIGIKILTSVLRRALGRVYTGDDQLIGDLVVLIVTIVLWFSAGLALLSILGMTQLAASLGTATGFIALGISYALSNMIEDTVVGVYLLRDPDFNPGDTVTTADVTGTVESIGMRKSRIRNDDGTLEVLANRNVESRWTWKESPPAE
jgi:small-conductance mechanosensitive channel